MTRVPVVRMQLEDTKKRGAMNEQDIDSWFAMLVGSAEDHADAIQRAYQALRDTKDARGVPLLNRVALHRYQCHRGCQIAIVFKAAGRVMCAVRDYKYSPGLNEKQSVESARSKNTIDGDRHWPSHVYDVTSLADWGDGTGMSLACRHYRGLLSGAQVLRDVAGVEPGSPRKPTRLKQP